jgi:hypothetical protein
MKKLLLGNSPITSIIGYVITGLGLLNEALNSGENNWFRIGMYILVGLFGRKAGDAV